MAGMDMIIYGGRACEHVARGIGGAVVTTYYVSRTGYVYRVRDGQEDQPRDADGTTWRATDGADIASRIMARLDREGVAYHVIDDTR